MLSPQLMHGLTTKLKKSQGLLTGLSTSHNPDLLYSILPPKAMDTAIALPDQGGEGNGKGTGREMANGNVKKMEG